LIKFTINSLLAIVSETLTTILRSSGTLGTGGGNLSAGKMLCSGGGKVKKQITEISLAFFVILFAIFVDK